jgi:PAS domain S-box-containing protein
MGLGIVAMHYTGMAAMRMAAGLSYDPLWVAISVIIAISAASTALWLAFRKTGIGLRLAAAVAMGFAISGMHYSAMRAAIFTAHADAVQVPAAAGLDQTKLGFAVAITTFVLVLIALAAAAEQRQKAERALRESEHRLRATFENAAVGIAHLSPDGRWLRCNQRLCEITGYPCEELLRRTSQDLTHPDDLDADLARARRVLAGEIETYTIEKRYFRKDGSIVWVSLTVSLVRRGDGAPDYFISVIADITGRKQAEAEAAHLAAIVESSDDAIIGETLEGRITAWNAGAERIFGYTASEMIGQPILRIIPPELHGEEEQTLSRLKRGERIDHFETTRVTKDARRIDISLTVSPVRDKAGKVIGASKVSRDITERKRAEEHLRSLMRELSHRTKNVMAVVHGISWQTARQSPDIKDFEQRFTQRLAALSSSHDLLVRRDWQGVALEDLVRAQLEPFLDSAKERLGAHGPALLLRPQAAQDLGMALHELATNASKYGALSVPTGKIEIAWTVDGETADGKRFRMTWRESGGPMVSPPGRTGFGSKVITRSLSGTLKGKTDLEYRAEGVSWQLTAPMGGLIAELH